ncbi:hypothetical protein ACF07Y_45915 [Streptomyces sp. NPDC016566]|uniref:hypothetical protein n=1 Tax=Streptomyces sp. NPDC016566 TaxID=3364967 RepID=UPI0036FB6047
MALLGRRRDTAPRLAPELDDTELGKVRKRLVDPAASNGRTITIAMIEQLLRASGRDWDRRAHRTALLAESTTPAFQRSWAEDRVQDPDAQLLFAWGVLRRTMYEESPDPNEAGEAYDASVRASSLRPEDPNPWVVRLGLLRLWRRPNVEVFPLWREIVQRDRWHREAHLQMLRYLSPRECGSRAQVVEFVDQVRHSAPPATPTAGIELVALVDLYRANLEHGGVEAITAGHLWTRVDAMATLDNALANWPRQGYLNHAAAVADLNVLAYALVQAKRTRQASEVFGTIRGLVTAYPWNLENGDPVGTFTNWQRRAKG